METVRYGINLHTIETWATYIIVFNFNSFSNFTLGIRSLKKTKIKTHYDISKPRTFPPIGFKS